MTTVKCHLSLLFRRVGHKKNAQICADHYKARNDTLAVNTAVQVAPKRPSESWPRDSAKINSPLNPVITVPIVVAIKSTDDILKTDIGYSHDRHWDHNLQPLDPAMPRPSYS